MQHTDKEVEKRFYELPEDIQYVLYIEYFSFLKKHFNEREMFKEICPTVFDLYDKIAYNPIRQGEINPSISFIYENFLADLKISLMRFSGIKKTTTGILLLMVAQSIISMIIISN